MVQNILPKKSVLASLLPKILIPSHQNIPIIIIVDTSVIILLRFEGYYSFHKDLRGANRKHNIRIEPVYERHFIYN